MQLALVAIEDHTPSQALSPSQLNLSSSPIQTCLVIMLLTILITLSWSSYRITSCHQNHRQDRLFSLVDGLRLLIDHNSADTVSLWSPCWVTPFHQNYHQFCLVTHQFLRMPTLWWGKENPALVPMESRPLTKTINRTHEAPAKSWDLTIWQSTK